MSNKSKMASISLAVDNGDRILEQSEPYRATALIVEDHRVDAETLRLMLQALEFQCDSVMTAEDAIRTLNARPYDVIVTEVDLPTTLGISVIRSARESPLNYGRPVIVTSTIDDFSIRRSAILAGADDYLVKPLKLDVLRSAILNGVARKHISAGFVEEQE